MTFKGNLGDLTVFCLFVYQLGCFSFFSGRRREVVILTFDWAAWYIDMCTFGKSHAPVGEMRVTFRTGHMLTKDDPLGDGRNNGTYSMPKDKLATLKNQ